ncbi:hypothetical protein YC2023_095256 [Brassica napus]
MSPTKNKVHKVPPFPFGLYYSKKENARKSTSNFKEAVNRTDEVAKHGSRLSVDEVNQLMEVITIDTDWIERSTCSKTSNTLTKTRAGKFSLVEQRKL